MTEKKKPAPAKKAAPTKKAPAKKAAPAKKPAAPKKPAQPKVKPEPEVTQTPSGLAPLTGAVTPVTSNPSHEKTHVEIKAPVAPQKKKKSLLKRLFGR